MNTVLNLNLKYKVVRHSTRLVQMMYENIVVHSLGLKSSIIDKQKQQSNSKPW